MRKQSVVLKNRVDAAPVRRQVIETLTPHENLAGSRGLKTGDDTEQRSLARTAFAQNGEEFSLGDFQGNIAQYRVFPERFRDIADVEQRRRRRRNCSGLVR